MTPEQWAPLTPWQADHTAPRSTEIPVLVRWGSHMGDVRLFKAIPRIGDTIRYNPFDQPMAEDRVKHVIHQAHDPNAESPEATGWANPERPAVDIIVIRLVGRLARHRAKAQDQIGSEGARRYARPRPVVAESGRSRGAVGDARYVQPVALPPRPVTAPTLGKRHEHHRTPPLGTPAG